MECWLREVGVRDPGGEGDSEMVVKEERERERERVRSRWGWSCRVWFGLEARKRLGRV